MSGLEIASSIVGILAGVATISNILSRLNSELKRSHKFIDCLLHDMDFIKSYLEDLRASYEAANIPGHLVRSDKERVAKYKVMVQEIEDLVQNTYNSLHQRGTWSMVKTNVKLSKDDIDLMNRKVMSLRLDLVQASTTIGNRMLGALHQQNTATRGIPGGDIAGRHKFDTPEALAHKEEVRLRYARKVPVNFDEDAGWRTDGEDQIDAPHDSMYYNHTPSNNWEMNSSRGAAKRLTLVPSNHHSNQTIVNPRDHNAVRSPYYSNYDPWSTHTTAGSRSTVSSPGASTNGLSSFSRTISHEGSGSAISSQSRQSRSVELPVSSPNASYPLSPQSQQDDWYTANRSPLNYYTYQTASTQARMPGPSTGGIPEPGTVVQVPDMPTQSPLEDHATRRYHASEHYFGGSGGPFRSTQGRNGDPGMHYDENEFRY